MITSISPENRVFIAQRVDALFGKSNQLGTDLNLTSDIQLILSQFDIHLSAIEINQLLTDFEFDSKPVPGSVERVWFIALK